MDEQILSSRGEILKRYGDLLASYGGKIRLTGPSDPEILWNDHILDCLFTVSILPEKGQVLDVGSGGGLPGLVWAICRPDLEVTLLDSVKKKCGALEEMAAALEFPMSGSSGEGARNTPSGNGRPSPSQAPGQWPVREFSSNTSPPSSPWAEPYSP